MYRCNPVWDACLVCAVEGLAVLGRAVRGRVCEAWTTACSDSAVMARPRPSNQLLCKA